MNALNLPCRCIQWVGAVASNDGFPKREPEWLIGYRSGLSLKKCMHSCAGGEWLGEWGVWMKGGGSLLIQVRANARDAAAAIDRYGPAAGGHRAASTLGHPVPRCPSQRGEQQDRPRTRQIEKHLGLCQKCKTIL